MRCLCGVFAPALLSLALTSFAVAQPNVAQIRSGSASHTGDGTLVFYSVPQESMFVLTDVCWNPNYFPFASFGAVLSIVEGTTTRWQSWYHWGPYGNLRTDVSWHSGIVFSSGAELGFTVADVDPARAWTVNWSGYLVPAPLAASVSRDIALSETAWTSPSTVSPNPTSGLSVITYSIVSDSHIVLRIVDASGRLVRLLDEGLQRQGSRTIIWDGRDEHGAAVASGIYYYQVDAGGDGRMSDKIVIIR